MTSKQNIGVVHSIILYYFSILFSFLACLFGQYTQKSFAFRLQNSRDGNSERLVPANEYAHSHRPDHNLSLTKLSQAGAAGSAVGPGHDPLLGQQQQVY